MSISIKGVAQRALATLTMATTVLGLAGFAALAPATALAIAPADYGLHEGDTISAVGSGDPDIYIVNDWGYKRLFLNPVIFTFYGHLGWANVKTVSPATRDAFGTSGLFRNCETGDQRVWGLEVTGEDTGVLHWVNTTGAQAVIDDALFFRKVFCINNNEFNWYPKGADYTSVNQIPPYSRGGTGNPTPTPSGGPLQGGAGSLQSAEFVASLDNEDVGEGQNNIAVSGLDLEADNGSDLRVTSVRVAFEQVAVSALPSDDLDDYSDQVSIWFDGVKVGTADVADFDENSGVWSKSISLTGDAVVRMSQTKDLRVAVSAIDNIDSVDLDNDDWTVAIENVRYVDAQGAVTTETTLDDIGDNGTAADRHFQFEDFAAAADLELNLNEATDNPDARVVDVDDSGTTDGVVLLSGNLEASGGDIMVKELTVNVATTGADLRVITDSLTLEVDSVEVQTINTSTDCTAAGVCVFDSVDRQVNDGDSAKVRVLADINGTDDIGVQGATLTASINNATTDAEDENGDNLVAGDLTGTANGEAQSFFDEGIQTTFTSGTAVNATSDGTPDIGTFTITFKAKAFDTRAFIDRSCHQDPTPPTSTTASAGEGIIFGHNGSGVVTSCVVDSTTVAGSQTSSSSFEILEGATETFTLTVAIQGGDSFETVALESINWATHDVPLINQFYTFDLENYKTTPPLYLSSI